MEYVFKISNKAQFQEQLLHYYSNFKNLVFLNSNDETQNLFAVSNSDVATDENWQFGFIAYDYKNQIERLTSTNIDHVNFPEKYFFSPEILYKISDTEVEVVCYIEENIDELIKNVKSIDLNQAENQPIKLISRISKNEYIEKVNKLLSHIQLGDIYEVNFCQEFFAEQVEINPLSIYLKFNEKSPTPFSCFVKCDDKFLMSASPERFIKKEGDKLISQPIKGTIRRGQSEIEDEALKQQLLNDPKELSENVMIVDLVRNDLSKIAEKATVNVDELFGIYTFPQVHQMISTVSAQLKDNVCFDEIIKATFPMGSMTGAPKIRAMELIEEYETTKRGIYSGTVGCINDTGDFDFNVVIRSITYNQKNNYLSFIVGGAITANSDPEKEYEECLLKAKAMMEVLSNNA